MIFSDNDKNIIKNNIISIGTCCYYGLYKNKFFKDLYIKNNGYNKSKIKNIDKGITNFFDWLLCVYPNNVEILKITDPNQVFKCDNWSVNKSRKKATLNKNVNYSGKYLIKSLHDYHNNLQNNVIDKYIRRHNRLIQTIKNKSNLIFVYSEELLDTALHNIIQTIKNLTNNKFTIILWSKNPSIINSKHNYTIKEINNISVYTINMHCMTNNKLLINNRYYLHPGNINTELLFYTMIAIYNKELK